MKEWLRINSCKSKHFCAGNEYRFGKDGNFYFKVFDFTSEFAGYSLRCEDYEINNVTQKQIIAFAKAFGLELSKEERFIAGTTLKSGELELMLVAIKSDGTIARCIGDVSMSRYFDLLIIKGSNIGMTYGGKLILNNMGASLSDIIASSITFKKDEYKLQIINPVYYKEKKDD